MGASADDVDGEDPVVALLELLATAAERARDVVLGIHSRRENTSMAIVVHFRAGRPIEAHQHAPLQRPPGPAPTVTSAAAPSPASLTWPSTRSSKGEVKHHQQSSADSAAAARASSSRTILQRTNSRIASRPSASCHMSSERDARAR